MKNDLFSKIRKTAEDAIEKGSTSLKEARDKVKTNFNEFVTPDPETGVSKATEVFKKCSDTVLEVTAKASTAVAEACDKLSENISQKLKERKEDAPFDFDDDDYDDFDYEDDADDYEDEDVPGKDVPGEDLHDENAHDEDVHTEDASSGDIPIEGVRDEDVKLALLDDDFSYSHFKIEEVHESKDFEQDKTIHQPIADEKERKKAFEEACEEYLTSFSNPCRTGNGFKEDLVSKFNNECRRRFLTYSISENIELVKYITKHRIDVLKLYGEFAQGLVRVADYDAESKNHVIITSDPTVAALHLFRFSEIPCYGCSEGATANGESEEKNTFEEAVTVFFCPVIKSNVAIGKEFYLGDLIKYDYVDEPISFADITKILADYMEKGYVNPKAIPDFDKSTIFAMRRVELHKFTGGYIDAFNNYYGKSKLFYHRPREYVREDLIIYFPNESNEKDSDK